MTDFASLYTERLCLRRLQPGDLQRFAAYRADPELARYQGWSAMSEAQAQAFIAEMQDAPAYLEEAWLQIAIARREDDALIGDIGLCLHVGGEAEIGFTLMHEAQGQGLATEALQALIARLWAQPGLQRVIGITDARNLPSIRVLERLGMRQTGSEQTLFKGETCTELRYEIDAASSSASTLQASLMSTSPKAIAASLSEFWSPRVIAELDDAYVKVAKLSGSLAWHAHEHEDELFFILKGRLRIELEHAPAVELAEGEMFVVPRGVRHNPVAENECHIMLIEKKSTQHTGGEVTEKTRSLADQLRPL